MNRNNKRKIIIIGAVLILLLFALAGCSKSDTDNIEAANASNEEPNTEEPVVEDNNTVEVTSEPTNPEVPVIENTETSNTETSNQETVNQEQITPEPTNTEAPVVENTETSNPTANGITVVSDWGTPQEYNEDPEGRGPGRIIVKGFDYNDIFPWGSTPMAWRGEYWTASNGVEIKVLSVDGRATGMVPVLDGKGKDNEPNSPFQVAVAECTGEDLNDYAANLNVTIPLASYKRTEIDINDADLVAYRDAYDYKL